MTDMPNVASERRVFQLTSSRRGWLHLQCCLPGSGTYFNSHPHEEDDILWSPLFDSSNLFQLTSSRRGWQWYGETVEQARHFNSHPHEEDDQSCRAKITEVEYFNSHPHEEDDVCRQEIYSVWSISTHILTKRMTDVRRCFIMASTFQLTSSRRGWLLKQGSNIIITYFNSHPHEEDDWCKEMFYYGKHISTHILTKRMTLCFTFVTKFNIFQLTSSRRGWRSFVNPSCLHPLYFNSHPHEEDDCSRTELVFKTYNFNSHPHEEDDLIKTCGISLIKYFNSHPHEEDDYNALISCAVDDISTHILTKRMTFSVWFWLRTNVISTHILTKRMTEDLERDGAVDDISTHILTKRMTIITLLSSNSFVFQLTSSRRGWRWTQGRSVSEPSHFNSHPHEEDDCSF